VQQNISDLDSIIKKIKFKLEQNESNLQFKNKEIHSNNNEELSSLQAKVDA
jgi:hypothetical protein